MGQREQVWNTQWQFAPAPGLTQERWNGRLEHGDFVPVTLPHTCRELPFDSFDERVTQGVWVYRKVFPWCEEYTGRRLALRFDGVMCCAAVAVNGQIVARHEGGFTPFTAELTDRLVPEADNCVEVWVDSSENPEVAPFGGVIDYLTFGGIYRDVTLLITDPSYTEDMRVWGEELLTAHPRFGAEVTLGGVPAAAGMQLTLTLTEAGGAVCLRLTQPLAEGQQTAVFSAPFPNGEVHLWSVDDPYRYTVQCTLSRGENPIDCLELRTGFREARFAADGFMFNGRRLPLVGANRHQAYPYVGYAMPRRVQRKDADILKYEWGLNLVRTSHYPQSPHFLERCDEIGLLVFEELPGWHHIGDEAWKHNAQRQLEEMIVRDRSRPSVILWGVRINESLDDHAFYTENNALAHRLDPTRPTAGVRAILSSEFLEDVFTFNEFIYNGTGRPIRPQQEVTGLDRKVPYLITEFAGHMYPAKRFDAEERLVEHALRHARVQDAVRGDDTVCGAVFWCAFDYNTHCEFGSGSRVCFHGVSDAFRLPKYAAWFYESQIDPSVRGVLYPASVMSMGERSGSGLTPLVIFTNHERVRLYSGDTLLGEYFPDREHYPHLPHPPVIVSEGLGFLWGDFWQGITVEAYDGDAMVQRVQYARAPYADRLCLTADDTELEADGSDATRVVISLLDQAGHPMVYTCAAARLRLEGKASLIGSQIVPLIGGSAACWIRAGEEPGEVTLYAETETHRAKPLSLILRQKGRSAQ